MMSRPAPKHAPRVPFALLLVGLVVGGLAALLALNTASAANELRRHDLAAQDAGVSAQLEQLRNEVAASSAPGNLARVAGQLGMVPAGNPAFLEIGTDGSVKVLGSPAPASAPPVAPTQTAHPHPHTSATKTASTATASATSTARSTARSTAKSTAKSSATKSAGATGSSSSAKSAKSSTSTAKSSRHRSTAASTPNVPQPSATTTLPGGTR